MWIVFVLFVKIVIAYGFAIEKKELGNKIDITEANFTVGEDITLNCIASDPLDTCKWVHKNIKDVVVMCLGTRELNFKILGKSQAKAQLEFLLVQQSIFF